MSADQASAHRNPIPRARRTPLPPWILMYHSVALTAQDPYQITVSPHRLDQQLHWLARSGLTGVSVRELLRARAAGRGSGLVGLTFDDGYADFVEHALPLLRRHDFGATLFVLPGRLGKDNAWDPLGPRKPLLTAEGIRAAARAGVEIGSHGLQHANLPAGDDTVRKQETAYSRQLLRDITGRAPEGFCYPYGAVDERSALAVRRAGYSYACAIDPGTLTGPYALPRAYIGQNDGRLRLQLKRMLHPLRRRPLGEEPQLPTVGREASR
ncbi:polysaccharide deacetylase family protein [Streptomyces sp. P38-E01]|uniref:Polysaccharide deacetylase family protein n=1 Tax=Streptomyces tardus TaxID=2780544 RepID=A0A949JJH6_9ACTN|nr:polysaccharide deacetylase family protein [Streptomyces tardus]MBU7599835.1 polysaccharide deacetylase family protein [Streptomyces tardus]